MTTPRSLRAAFTWWFAGTLLVLYGVAATGVWLHARSSDRHYAILTLKAEAEVVAGYLATTGRLDAPEFLAPEATPFPTWFRLVQGDKVLAETPGTPGFGRVPTMPITDRFVTQWSSPLRGDYLIVYHAVGGPLGGATLEAIAPMKSLISTQFRLAAALSLIGLVVIPLAALGGRALALRALRPIEGLVAKIHALDSTGLGKRLDVPPGSAQEVAVLASAFNELLGRLEASVETMRRFTAYASHEIRNPLSVIRTGLEVALRRPRPAEDYHTLLQENLQEIARLQAVLEGLLVLARDVPGQEYLLAKTPVDLSRLLEETADAFSTVAAERGIRIEEDIELALMVEGDAQLLRLVAFNLLDNALKYSPPRETVELRACARAGEIELLVTDRGPGVVAEDREHLFRRFFRADPTAGSAVGGLGLSVVCWVTELHGGGVRLLDTERGAAFEVRLPRAAMTETISAAPLRT